MKIKTVVAAVAAVLSVSAAPVFAADAGSIPGISTDSIVSQIGSVGTMVGAVGMAVLAVVMGIKAVGYIRSAMGY